MLETRPSVKGGAVAEDEEWRRVFGAAAMFYIGFHGSIWAGWPPRAWEVNCLTTMELVGF